MLGSVVTAGGSGVRFGGEKILALVRGEPLICLTLRRIRQVAAGDPVVLVLPPDRLEAIVSEHGERLRGLGVTAFVAGGPTRQQSVANGVAALPDEADPILVHDAVRPLFPVGAARRAVEEAMRVGAAILAEPARDTLKRVDTELRIRGTVERSEVWHAETPQVVRRDLLREALRSAAEAGFSGTDEASLVERLGRDVVVVRSGPWNVKVTERQDLRVVEALAAGEPGSGGDEVNGTFRVGMGYDLHRLVEGRPLFLGGVEIHHARGLLGHSDGDALLHALADALLGAAGLGDIGEHFPDTDPRFAGADSSVFVTHVVSLLDERGFRVVNADVTVVAQEPKLSPHRDRIRERIATLLSIEPARVNVKATTKEGLGPVGEGLAIEAHAVVLVTSEAS